MPVLPPELLRGIFELAALSTMPEKLATAVTLTQVSRAAREWMLPVLYNTVCLSDVVDRERFLQTVTRQPGTYPVHNLSILTWPAPSGADFTALLAALPHLSHTQIPLALVPFLVGASSSLTHLFISKHGPTQDVPLVPLPSITHIFIEPFYNGLYPIELRVAMPTLFPNATHFGMSYVLSNDDVSRDLVLLFRDMLALPSIQQVYVRILSHTPEGAENDAATMRGLCKPIRDPRIRVGSASVVEWICPPGQERINSSRSLWAADTLGRLDMWAHGTPAYP
ncbi:hypothetical protein EXIGLDRAFT_794874 [Exidia glandulosa HHB12029]|uniref:F-box domain-containing protein n=1 Tax=Exidia glandulosa HHB12029 TaxID=1314781 RepID=A0A165G8U6_EXIGL|nr:hypothetical protein EXIGLDRAFT_794874 [Exidia glandulosa HHB12029]